MDSTQFSQVEVTSSTIPAQDLEALTATLVTALKTVYDPEIPVDIYELGLIYKVDKVEGIGTVTVNMTFDPPWTPERMSEEARLELNMF